MPADSLLALFDIYKRAAAAKDVELMMSIFDDGIRAFDTWSAWQYQGSAAWRAMNENWFRSLGADRDVVAFEDVDVVAEGSVGYGAAIATYSAVSDSGAVLRSMQTRLTWIARKSADGWRIVHQHASVPIDDDGKAVFKR